MMAHPAIAFLRILDPNPSARFGIETYTDVPRGGGKPKPDHAGRQFDGLSIDEVEALLPQLESLNKLGAGVFVAVNEFDGRRRKDHLSRVRGVHADLDGVDDKKLSKIRSILSPTIEVQTSGPYNRHFYWLLAQGETIDVTLAVQINRSLIALGADPAATDITRLLRLPGFKHMKNRGRKADA